MFKRLQGNQLFMLCTQRHIRHYWCHEHAARVASNTCLRRNCYESSEFEYGLRLDEFRMSLFRFLAPSLSRCLFIAINSKT